ETIWNACMYAQWVAYSDHEGCPHRDANCACYNGCVVLSSGLHANPGGICAKACRKENYTALPCTD
ncbi:unnamed protein product, partial [Tilletia controversa]